MAVVSSPESQTPFRESAPKAGQWTILCDFDGAVTPIDVTDAILNAFADPCWKEARAEWLAGRISACERMDREVGLVKIPAVILDAWLDEKPLTAGFPEFARLCKKLGAGLVVVSEGLDHAIRRILTRHGLPNLPIVANRLRYKGNSAWRLEFPRGAQGCPFGLCKCEVARALGERTLLIGAGRSSCCAAGATSMTFARRGGELARHCAANGLPCMEFDDFYGVAEPLQALLNDKAPRPEILPGRDAVRPDKPADQPAGGSAGKPTSGSAGKPAGKPTGGSAGGSAGKPAGGLAGGLAGGRKDAAGLLDAVLGRCPFGIFRE